MREERRKASERGREREIERAIRGRREEESKRERGPGERERGERTRLGAMCIGERIHIVRFGGKVFGQVQGDAAAAAAAAAAGLSLSLSLSSSLSRTVPFPPPASFARRNPFFLLFLPFPLSSSVFDHHSQGCSFRFVFRLRG